MISSEYIHLLGVFDLVGEEEADALDPLPSSIHVVPQEQVARLGRMPTVLEQPQQVVILAMNIPAYLNGCRGFEQHGFLHELFLHQSYQPHNLVLLEGDQLARLARPHLQQRPDDLVDVDLHLLQHLNKNSRLTNHPYT